MEMVRVGFASVNTTVGATKTNTDKAVEAAGLLAGSGCAIVVMQECLFGGYSAEDMNHIPEFAMAQWREMLRFAEATAPWDSAFFTGIVVHGEDGRAFNASAVIYRGRILAVVPKEHNPNYNIFYEGRIFSAGSPGLQKALKYGGHPPVPFGDYVFKFPFGTVAAHTCEDTWDKDGMHRRADIYAIGNSSPARHGVVDTRRQMLATRSADLEAVLIAAYQVGGNDGVVFDGGGFVFQNGQLLKQGPAFVEHTTYCDVDLSRTKRMRRQNTTWRIQQEKRDLEGDTSKTIVVEDGPGFHQGAICREFAERFAFFPTDPKELEKTLDYGNELTILGLQDYVEKNDVFECLLIPLSGGSDSELTLLFAVQYARRKFAHLPPIERKKAIKKYIICLSLPTRHNSETTKSIARESAEQAGVTFIEKSIQEEYERECAELERICGRAPTPLEKGNVQTRIRFKYARNLANMFRALLLQTSNMSEKSVGYSTIGGDLDGDFSLIGNMPKTMVYVMLAYLGKKLRMKFVKTLLQTKASAELEDGQTDEADLMPYAILDMCLLLFLGELYSPVDMYRVIRARWTDKELAALDPRLMDRETKKIDTKVVNAALKGWVEKFLRRFSASVYKWVVAPLAIHRGNLDLDRERCLQIPVVKSLEFLEDSLKEMHAYPDLLV